MSFSLNCVLLKAWGKREQFCTIIVFLLFIAVPTFKIYCIYNSLVTARMVDDCSVKNTNWSVNRACSLHCASPDQYNLTLQPPPLSDMSCSCCHIHDRMTCCGVSSNPVAGRCSLQCSTNYCNRNYYLTNSRTEENYNTAFLNRRS